MLSHTIKEVFVAQHAVDFRKGIAGLLAEAYGMELNPYKGECIIFIHKSRRKLRVLCGNELGIWLLERQFDGGRIEFKLEFMTDPAIKEISVAELGMILDGNDFVTEKRPKKW